MDHIELVQNYPTARVEVILSKGKVLCTQNRVESDAVMKVTSKGVHITFGRNYLSRGEEVMYPEGKYVGKLVPYKYGTNFKTIDIALSEYKKWEAEFTEVVIQ